MVVIEIKRFVEIVDLGQVGVGKDIGKDAPLAALPGLQMPRFRPHPAAVPAFLVFPILGIADAGLGLDVVEPRVFDPLARGPDVLAGDRTGMTADAFVQVQHHADLCAHFHSAASVAWVAGRSSQSILSSLRTMTNSSRLAPTVP